MKDAEEAIGTEPVSPHYESFTMSRRAPLLGGIFIMMSQWLEELNLGSFYGQQFTYEFYTLAIVLIGVNESRYVINRLPLPRLTWFYDAFNQHEMQQTILNWFDSIEENTHQHLAETKEQIDYYLIHKEYSFVKKRVLATYLENERQGLTKHFESRSLNMLNNIHNLENGNIKEEISQVSHKALSNVLEVIENPSKNQAIIETSFESALEGLKSGEMVYNNDKVLPLFLNELNVLSEPLSKLTPEEENKRYCLSDKQRQYVIDSDTASKQEYLKQEPKVPSSIKNTETYKNILARIQSKH